MTSMSDTAKPSPATPLLEAKNVSKHFSMSTPILQHFRGSGRETLKAVEDVSLSIDRGETLGLVGESGCGKSTLGRVLLRLYEPTSGQVLLDGEDILTKTPAGMRAVRKRMQIIFQDPYSSLNPSMTVRQTLDEVLAVHKLAPKPERRRRISELLEMVGLSAEMAGRKPSQFSGGQRQRIGIARALAMGPELIVADEAVSALDVSVQAQVLNLMMRLQDDLGLTYLFISHNLGVVEHISQRVAVMYLGKIVELSPTVSLFTEPKHPYTQALLAAVPKPIAQRKKLRAAVQGDPPNPLNPPSGCPFHTRCPHVMPICREEYPVLRPAGESVVACHLYQRSGISSA